MQPSEPSPLDGEGPKMNELLSYPIISALTDVSGPASDNIAGSLRLED